MEQYSYKREITGISEQWHKIILPDDIFGKISNDLSDIRIYGIGADGDTVEAPYLLNVLTDKSYSKKIDFKTLNTSHNSKGYYFTFEVPSKEAVNQIKLQFEQDNFDWLLHLEGSHKQQEWFTVLKDYRILSIKNELSDFQFTTLTFPSTKYRFFRILIKAKEKPQLTMASLLSHEVTDAVLRDCGIKDFSINENRATKQTEVDVVLQSAMPLSSIKVNVDDKFDFYRPITIKYLVDSVKTDKGWIFSYRNLAYGILHSKEDNEFILNSPTVQKLKLLIHNQDNKPLHISSVQAKGYIYELMVRFDESATYYLSYGNAKANYPSYDIHRFTDNIPTVIFPLKLADEVAILKEKSPVTAALFENELWLWVIIGVLIVVMGWFSLSMIRRKAEEE